VRIIAKCWSCGKSENITNLPAQTIGLLCDCGGYVISPSGKVQIEIVESNQQ
jgi:hypothetical protein